MDLNKILNEIERTIIADLKTDSYIGRADITAVNLTREGMDDASISVAKEASSKFEDKVEKGLKNIFGLTIESELTDVQMEAAKAAAILANDPLMAYESLTTLDYNDVANVVTPAQFGAYDAVEPGKLTTESFSNIDIEKSITWSIIANIEASKQDDFSEAFYPTIIVPANQAIAELKVDVAQVQVGFTRGKDGKVGKGFQRIPLVKTMKDPTLVSAVETKLIPVLRTETAPLLLDTITSTNTERGQSITTAPIRTGVEVDLIGLSQSDEDLKQGEADDKYTLSAAARMKNVYVEVTDDGGNKETIVVSVKNLLGSGITPTSVGSTRDIQLNFKNRGVILNSNSVTVKPGNAASAIFGAIPANTKIRFNIVMSGFGNVDEGKWVAYGNEFSIANVYDSNGKELQAGNATYDAVTTKLAKLEIVGYDIDATITNENLAHSLHSMNIETMKIPYALGIRPGFIVDKPVNSAGKNDPKYILGYIAANGLKVTDSAVNALVNQFNDIEATVVNGIPDIDTNGIGRYFISSYFARDNIDVATEIDSLRSGQRVDDIKGLLHSNVIQKINEMVNATGIKFAYRAYYGVKDPVIDVTIGCDADLSAYLEGINGGKSLNIKVVNTDHKQVNGKIFITFGNHRSDRNSKVSPLGFGNLFLAPTAVIDAVVTKGKSTTRQLHSVLKFSHINHISAGAVITVTNIQGSLSKIAQNTHNV